MCASLICQCVDELLDPNVDMQNEEEGFRGTLLTSTISPQAVSEAWIVGRVSEEEAVSSVARVFVKAFVNGGKEEGSISGEFMPVGADGKIVLSFNLLNVVPHDWTYYCFCIIEGHETVQDFAKIESQEIQDNI